MIGPGGPLDGLLSTRFLLAFIACGLVLVSRGMVFAAVTINYGNSNDLKGRDLSTLHVVGSETVQMDDSEFCDIFGCEDDEDIDINSRFDTTETTKKTLSSLLTYLNSSKIFTKSALDDLLKYCDQYQDLGQCHQNIDSLPLPTVSRTKQQANDSIEDSDCEIGFECIYDICLFLPIL